MILGAYNFYPFIPAIVSVLSVPLALSTLEVLGFKLGNTRGSPLNIRNYKHIALFTIFSALFNALLINITLSQLHVNFQDTPIIDVMQVTRFFLGDILGTISVFIVLALILTPFLRSQKKKFN